MRRGFFIALAAAAGTLTLGSPAQAEVIICEGANCVDTDENVLVDAATGAAVITGTTNTTNVDVTFTSMTDALLNGSANGQADISSSDGLLNSLTFALTGGATFATATFNLFPLPGNALNEAIEVIISYWSPTLGEQTVSISTNGQNFFGLFGTAGEVFTSIAFRANPETTGIQDMRQVRLGGVNAAAVPEPGTWAMMLLGFGAIGYALRRRRRSYPQVLQIA